MDYIYKSRFFHDLDGHREFTRSYHEGNNISRSLFIIYSILAIVWMTWFDLSSFVYRFLLLASAVLIIYLVNNSKKGDIQYKRMLQANSGEPVRQEQYFTETGIHVVNMPSGNHFDLAYDQLRLVIESKNLLLLVMKHRSCVILDKSTLTGGSIDQFFAFLKAHCPNLKSKKPRKTTLGKWLRWIFAVILVLGTLWALLNLPAFSVMDRVLNRLDNSMSYEEMADELAELEIGISQRAIDEIEQYDADYLEEYGEDFYDGAFRNQKISDLLYWEGSGFYNEMKGRWQPSTSGVFWQDYYSEELENVYPDFFIGLSAMDEALQFSNVQVDLSKVIPDAGLEATDVSFQWQGNTYTLEVPYTDHTFSKNIISQIGEIVNSGEQKLYVCYDSSDGVLFYFGTADQVRTLEKRTAMDFKDATSRIW